MRAINAELLLITQTILLNYDYFKKASRKHASKISLYKSKRNFTKNKSQYEQKLIYNIGSWT